jgi:protein-tyrosine phosphatase
MRTRVLFVCLGNICRSPTAEGVFRARAQAAGLTDLIIDSAGTAAWHVGKRPDERTIRAAHQRGYDLAGLRARQVQEADFQSFDLILAMDRQNLNDLNTMRPASAVSRVDLFLSYATQLKQRDVPDPYYGGGEGFELVLDMVEQASDGLIEQLRGG